MFWTQVLRFAGVLMAREQFVPGLAEHKGTYRACWEPILLGTDAERLARLGGAMPQACRALTSTSATPPDVASIVVVTAVLKAFVDELVRTALPERSVSAARVRTRTADAFASVHDQWLHALRFPDGVMDGDQAGLEQLAKQIRAWHRPIAISTDVPFRLSFRLEEPAPSEASEASIQKDPGPWYVRFLLQASDDPSLPVEVTGAWEPDKRTAAAKASNAKGSCWPR